MIDDALRILLHLAILQARLTVAEYAKDHKEATALLRDLGRSADEAERIVNKLGMS